MVANIPKSESPAHDLAKRLHRKVAEPTEVELKRLGRLRTPALRIVRRRQHRQHRRDDPDHPNAGDPRDQADASRRSHRCRAHRRRRGSS